MTKKELEVQTGALQRQVLELQGKIFLLTIKIANLQLGHKPLPEPYDAGVSCLTRMLCIGMLFLGLALPTGCIRQVRRDIITPPIVRDVYVIQQTEKPDIYLVWLSGQATPADFMRAKREIGCGICIETPDGTVTQVERFPQGGLK